MSKTWIFEEPTKKERIGVTSYIGENEKYLEHIRTKIIQFFNLRNADEELQCLYSIIEMDPRDMQDSLFFVTHSLHQKDEMSNYSKEDIIKFTHELIEDYRMFNPSKSNDLINCKDDTNLNGNGKDSFASNSIEYFPVEHQRNDNSCDGVLNSDVIVQSEEKKLDTILAKVENNSNCFLEKTNDHMISGLNKKQERNKEPLNSSYNIEKKTKHPSRFHLSKNSYSLRKVIQIVKQKIWREDTKDNETDNDDDDPQKKIMKMEVCSCNGRNHKIFANCLLCGKVYCCAMKQKVCINCNHKLYDYSIFDNIYLDDIEFNSVKKLRNDMKKKNPTLYRIYFDRDNEDLRNAYVIRKRMLKNYEDDNQIKVIDDSIDWFEADIAKELNNNDIHFKNYSDELKDEILNKYQEIFGKHYGDINIDIDLINLKIEENVDYFKVKEFKEYLESVEEKYKLNKMNQKVQQHAEGSFRTQLDKRKMKNENFLSELKNILLDKDKDDIKNVQSKISMNEQTYIINETILVDNFEDVKYTEDSENSQHFQNMENVEDSENSENYEHQ